MFTDEAGPLLAFSKGPKGLSKINVSIRLVLLLAGGVDPPSQIALCLIVAPCQRPKLRRPIDTRIFLQAPKLDSGAVARRVFEMGVRETLNES